MSDDDMDGAVVICRACMNECIEYKSIYKGGVIMNEVTTLAKILQLLTNLEFPEYEDTLPAQLCLKCVHALAKAYTFRKMVLHSNTALRQFTELGTESKTDSQLDEVNTNYTNEVTKHLRCKDSADKDKANYENIEFISNEIEDAKAYEAMLVMHDNSVHMEDYQTEVETTDMLVTQEHEQEQEQDQEHDSEQQQTQEEHYELHHLADVEEEEVVVHEVVEECDLNDMNNFGDDSNQMSIVKLEENTMEAYEITLDHSEQASSTNEVDQQSQQHDSDIDGYQFKYIKRDMDSDSSLDKTQKIILRKQNGANLLLEFNGNKTIQSPVQTRKINTKREKNPDFQCKKCGKQLSNAGSFKYHMQLHSDKKPFLCSLCGEGFKTRNAYDGHMSLHNPNNPNTCEICGKSYRQPSSLRAHMLTHTGEKPFQCEICGKGLTQKSGYKKHLLTHTDEKPHECDICGREFRYSSNLIAHKRIHNSNKPHKCTDCTKSFMTVEQLERHRTSLHELCHQCDLCPKRFRRRLSMVAHLNNEHCMDSFDPKLSKSNVVELL